MGVYINMEMPKKGSIEIRIYSDGRVIHDPIYACKRVVGRAVPIPPHGRLIDADAFIKRMEGLVHRAEADGYDLGAAWYTAFIRHIELAPTVIDAEEGKT